MAKRLIRNVVLKLFFTLFTSGVQIFPCSPINTAIFSFVAYEIISTYGGAQTYMNLIYLFTDDISSYLSTTSFSDLLPLHISQHSDSTSSSFSSSLRNESTNQISNKKENRGSSEEKSKPKSDGLIGSLPSQKLHSSIVTNKKKNSLDLNADNDVNVNQDVLEYARTISFTPSSSRSIFQRDREYEANDFGDYGKKSTDTGMLNSTLSSGAQKGIQMSNRDKPFGVLNDNCSSLKSNVHPEIMSRPSTVLLNVIEKQQEQLYRQQLMIRQGINNGLTSETLENQNNQDIGLKRNQEQAYGPQLRRDQERCQQYVDQRVSSTRDGLHAALGLFDEDETELLRDSEEMARGKLADSELFLRSDAQSSISVLRSNGFITTGDESKKNNTVDSRVRSHIGDDVTNVSNRSSRQDHRDHLKNSIDNENSGMGYNKSNYFDSGDTYSNLNNYYNIKNEKNWYEKEAENKNQNGSKTENTASREEGKISGNGENNRIKSDSLFTESESGSVRNIPKRRISPMTALLQSLLRIEENSVAEDEHFLPSPTLSSQTRSQSQIPSQYLPHSRHNSVTQYRPFSSFPFIPLSPSPVALSIPSPVSVSLQLPGSRSSNDGSDQQTMQSSLPLPRPPPLSLPIPIAIPTSPPPQIQDTSRSSPPLSSLNNTPSTVSSPPFSSLSMPPRASTRYHQTSFPFPFSKSPTQLQASNEETKLVRTADCSSKSGMNSDGNKGEVTESKSSSRMMTLLDDTHIDKNVNNINNSNNYDDKMSQRSVGSDRSSGHGTGCGSSSDSDRSSESGEGCASSEHCESRINYYTNISGTGSAASRMKSNYECRRNEDTSETNRNSKKEILSHSFDNINNDLKSDGGQSNISKKSTSDKFISSNSHGRVTDPGDDEISENDNDRNIIENMTKKNSGDNNISSINKRFNRDDNSFQDRSLKFMKDYNNLSLNIDDNRVADDISNGLLTSDRILSIEHRFDTLLTILSARSSNQSTHTSFSIASKTGDNTVKEGKSGERSNDSMRSGDRVTDRGSIHSVGGVGGGGGGERSNDSMRSGDRVTDRGSINSVGGVGGGGGQQNISAEGFTTSHLHAIFDGRRFSRIVDGVALETGFLSSNQTDRADRCKTENQREKKNNGDQLRIESPGESVFFSSSNSSAVDLVAKINVNCHEKGNTRNTEEEGDGSGRMRTSYLDGDKKGLLRDSKGAVYGDKDEDGDRQFQGRDEGSVGIHRCRERSHDYEAADEGMINGERERQNYRIEYNSNLANSNSEMNSHVLDQGTSYLEGRLLFYERQRQKILSNMATADSKYSSNIMSLSKDEEDMHVTEAQEARREEIIFALKVAERDRDQIRMIINDEIKKEERRILAFRIVQDEKNKENLKEKDKLVIDDLKIRLSQAEKKMKYLQSVEIQKKMNVLKEREMERDQELLEREEEVEKKNGNRDLGREEVGWELAREEIEIKLEREVEKRRELERGNPFIDDDIRIEDVGTIVKLLHAKVLQRVCKQTQLQMVIHKKKHNEKKDGRSIDTEFGIM